MIREGNQAIGSVRLVQGSALVLKNKYKNKIVFVSKLLYFLVLFDSSGWDGRRGWVIRT